MSSSSSEEDNIDAHAIAMCVNAAKEALAPPKKPKPKGNVLETTSITLLEKIIEHKIQNAQDVWVTLAKEEKHEEERDDVDILFGKDRIPLWYQQFVAKKHVQRIKVQKEEESSSEESLDEQISMVMRAVDEERGRKGESDTFADTKKKKKKKEHHHKRRKT